MRAGIYARMGIVLAAVLSVPAGAPIVTAEQRCAQGDQISCRLLELAKKIDFQKFAEGATYKLADGPRNQWSIVAAMTDKTEQRNQIRHAACTFYNEVWMADPVIEEYARLADLTTINRAGYDRCMELLQ